MLGKDPNAPAYGVAAFSDPKMPDRGRASDYIVAPIARQETPHGIA
jgi:hypothetical protein